MTAPVGAYCRCSTQIQSTKSQVLRVTEWAARTGREVQIYDEGNDLSGFLPVHKRKELTRLIADAHAGTVSAIVTSEVSRLQRREAIENIVLVGTLYLSGLPLYFLDRDESKPLQLVTLGDFLQLAIDCGMADEARKKDSYRAKGAVTRDANGVAVSVRNGKRVGRPAAIVCPHLLAQARARHESGTSLRQMVAEKTVLGVIRRKGEECVWIPGINALCAALRINPG